MAHKPKNLKPVSGGAFSAFDTFEGPTVPPRQEYIDRGMLPQEASAFTQLEENIRDRRPDFDPFLGKQAVLRDQATQDAIKSRGTSTVSKSKHQSGQAVDLRDRSGLWHKTPDNIDYTRTLGEEANKMGFRWGGDWHSKGGKETNWTDDIGWDPHHVEVPTASQYKTIKAKKAAIASKRIAVQSAKEDAIRKETRGALGVAAKNATATVAGATEGLASTIEPTPHGEPGSIPKPNRTAVAKVDTPRRPSGPWSKDVKDIIMAVTQGFKGAA